MLRWLKIGAGHAAALLLLVGGGLAGLFSFTILRDVLLLTPGKQVDGAAIGTLLFTMAGASMGLGGWLLYYLWGTEGPSDAATGREQPGRSSLHQLREGDVLDYELQTWRVAKHATFPYQGWPAETWTLERKSDGKKRVLEYVPKEGGSFQLLERVPVSRVTVAGDPFSAAAETGTPPPEIKYAKTGDTRYVLVEEDARAHDLARVRSGEANRISFVARSRTSNLIRGVFGGLAEYMNLSPWGVRVGYLFAVIGGTIGLGRLMNVAAGCCVFVPMVVGYFVYGNTIAEPPPERFSKYWVYESEENELVTLQCVEGTWTAHFGREVAPYEFNNILPLSED